MSHNLSSSAPTRGARGPLFSNRTCASSCAIVKRRCTCDCPTAQRIRKAPPSRRSSPNHGNVVVVHNFPHVEPGAQRAKICGRAPNSLQHTVYHQSNRVLDAFHSRHFSQTTCRRALPPHGQSHDPGVRNSRHPVDFVNCHLTLRFRQNAVDIRLGYLRRSTRGNSPHARDPSFVNSQRADANRRRGSPRFQQVRIQRWIGARQGSPTPRH